MTDRTYNIPPFVEKLTDLTDELFCAGADRGIVDVGVQGQITISIDDAAPAEIDAIWVAAIKSMQLKAKRNLFDAAMSKPSADRGDLLNSFYDTLEQDLNGVAAYAAVKYALPDLFLKIEIHLTRDHHCDLSIINAPWVQPRPLRVALREEAQHLLELMGYHFDLINGYDIWLYEPSSRLSAMSGHDKLRALQRVEAILEYQSVA
ncbi:hypothetical protein FHS72_003308 [Loktanella ponticola]|uniref:Uncharacterized protein n=1 Tax=Yoonia ponticola TaxID=1524255 RepID=A0A7W9BNC0_9RHOB|nr:hypothetical protein [Yoonia ponticola]MBB5723663.1 hypothetical protein [Yoonia ponticola]